MHKHEQQTQSLSRGRLTHTFVSTSALKSAEYSAFGFGILGLRLRIGANIARPTKECIKTEHVKLTRHDGFTRVQLILRHTIYRV